MTSHLRAIAVAALLFPIVPSAVEAGFTSTVSGSTATMVGDVDGPDSPDFLHITQSGGVLHHNRSSLDTDYASDADFDTTVPGVQTVSSTTGLLHIFTGGGDDAILVGNGVTVLGTVNGGPGNDTIEYTPWTTGISANLGLGTAGLSATLGADQEVPATASAAIGTATVSNYSIATHTFDITVTVSGLSPADVTGFHIHRAPVGATGPIIVDFGSGALTPAGDGFTFTANGVSLPSIDEAAFLGGATYVNIHTAAFPGGAIRGQLFSTGYLDLHGGAATGVASLAAFENVGGSTVGSSLVGNFGANSIYGTGIGAADWILGGPGSDTLNGEFGADTIMWNNGDGTDVVVGGLDSDVLQVNGSHSPGDAFVVSADETGPEPFTLDVSTVETITVSGLSGNDTFTVDSLSGVADLTALNLHGHDGSDAFNVEASATTAVAVAGGASADTLDYDAESRAVTGDTTPPEGTINSPGVQPVAFSQTETVTITNLEPAIAISDAIVSEGSMPASAIFTVTLSHTSVSTVTVNFATANGTANSPGDYSPLSGTVTFVPGDVSETISVPITNDLLPELTETFAVNLSGAVNAAVTDNQGVGTIADNDVASLSIDDVSIAEGQTGTTNATFTVTLTPAHAGTVTVDFATSNGTAIAPADFSAVSGTLTFTPSQTSKTITVPVHGETLGEPHESFVVTLSNPVNAVIGDSSGTGTILTDDFVKHDYDGDRRADLAVFRPTSGTWHILRSNTGFTSGTNTPFGLSGDVPAAGDYDGDGNTDIAVFRPSDSSWYILQSTTGTAAIYPFGLIGDLPVPGDYDGDGKTDPAVFRPATTRWYVLTSSSNYTGSVVTAFGARGDIPVPGDYDGDGRTEVTTYRPSTGQWFNLGRTFAWGLSGDVPVPADYDGDGITDVAVYRPGTGEWFILQSMSGFATAASFQWGLTGDVPVPSDVDGDGKTDLAVYRPPTGTWYIAQSTTNYSTSVAYQWGLSGDVPVPNAPIAHARAIRSTLATLVRGSDFDADRLADLTVYRPSTGMWYSLQSSTDFSSSTSAQWGLSGDLPVPHDYDGNGQTDVAVYRPSSGEWHINTGFTSFAYQWGLNGDLPVPGDYDGDGKSDAAVYRPSSGAWHLLRTTPHFTTSYQWGLSGDIPVPGEYDGDARTDLAVYRPSTGEWFLKYSSTDYATSASFQWGLPGDVSVPGDYDGDGKTDLAVYRPSTGVWFVRQSSTGYATSTSFQWGLTDDIPAPADFDGDRRTDFAVWRPSTGTWYLLLSSSNFTLFDQLQWGLPGDVPILQRP